MRRGAETILLVVGALRARAEITSPFVAVLAERDEQAVWNVPRVNVPNVENMVNVQRAFLVTTGPARPLVPFQDS